MERKKEGEKRNRDWGGGRKERFDCSKSFEWGLFFLAEAYIPPTELLFPRL